MRKTGESSRGPARAAAAWRAAAVCVGSALIAADRTGSHHSLLAAVPAALLPLAFTRDAARKVGDFGRFRPRLGLTSTAVTGATALAEPAQLACANARLARENAELRSACDELAQELAERESALKQLEFLAYHDALTKLPNRALLLDRLAHGLAQAQRADTGILVIYLDLDRFKRINDTLGHAAGDRVLVEVARRIAGCIRESDTAARIGGDEFVLVCPTVDGARDAERLRRRLTQTIAAPIDIDGRSVEVGASIGMSLFPDAGGDCADLINRADEAMYAAKVARRS